MELIIEKLDKLLDKRNRLYLKGGNDEKLNEQIRNLQKEIRENEEKK
jgi:glycogen synthase